MKAWRQRSSSSGGASAAAAVVVTSVVFNVPTGTTYVTFSANVTWDGVGVGTFEIDGNSAAWLSQVAANVLECDNGEGPGFPWDWTGADASLLPIPDSSQTGVTS